MSAWEFFLPLFGIFFVAPFIVRARISGQHENWKESVGDSFFVWMKTGGGDIFLTF